MKFRIMNAAGTARTLTHVEQLCRNDDLTDITIGAFTVPMKAGNGGRDFARIKVGTNWFSINSRGMPNGGIDFLREYLPEIWARVKSAGKRLRVNISPASQEELRELVALIISVSPEIIIEINLGCPNVWENGEQHEIWAFDSDLVRTSVLTAFAAAEPRRPYLALKLSPYSQPSLLTRVGKVILELWELGQGVREVVYSNTYPNCFLWDFDLDAPAIEPAGGLGGGAGAGLLPFVLGGVLQLTKMLRETDIIVIGAGGAESGDAIAQHIKAGSQGLQFGTVPYGSKVPPKAISDVLEEFANKYPKLAESVM